MKHGIVLVRHTIQWDVTRGKVAEENSSEEFLVVWIFDPGTVFGGVLCLVTPQWTQTGLQVRTLH